MRGFVTGVIWGGVVAVLGLGVVSQLAPLPKGDAPMVAANEPAAPQKAAPEVAAPDVSTAPVAEPAAQALPKVTVPGQATDGADAAAQVTLAPDTAAGTVAEPESAPDLAPELATSPEDVAPPAADADVATAPAAPEAPVVAEPPSAPEAPAAPTALAEPALPEAGKIADALPAAPDLPPVPPLSPEEETMLAPLPGEVPAHSPFAEDAASTSPVTAPVTAPPAPEAPAEPLLDRPEPGIAPAEGVTTDRLPRIEATPPVAAPDMAPAADDPRPIVRFAVPFANPQNKPLYAILIVDDGKAPVDRAALAALPLPVTVVLDPTDPDAAARAATYRKAGKEVAMLASAIPEGAKPSDLQVTFAAHDKALSEAVAVVDLPTGGFQNDRKLATDLVPVIKDQGRGLVTFDKGLNAGDQVARREAVPAALIFRELDAGGESAPVIRRYLDRAAFKAAQDGQVVVLGHATPDTIAALMEWSLEGRAGSVALAPLTAVLQAR